MKAAVLAMDFQKDICAMLPDQGAAILSSVRHVLHEARKAKLPVIHVRVGFREGYPEVSSNNSSFSSLISSGRFQMDSAGAQIHDDVYVAGEPVVIKHRVNAFFNTDLDMILRAKGVDTLFLTGISTSGVILSTLRYAADADYRCFVISDCCADPLVEAHDVLMRVVFPKQAAVIPSAHFLHDRKV